MILPKKPYVDRFLKSTKNYIYWPSTQVSHKRSLYLNWIIITSSVKSIWCLKFENFLSDVIFISNSIISCFKPYKFRYKDLTG